MYRMFLGERGRKVRGNTNIFPTLRKSHQKQIQTKSKRAKIPTKIPNSARKK